MIEKKRSSGGKESYHKKQDQILWVVVGNIAPKGLERERPR